MPRSASLPAGAPSDWLSLGPASRLLGVDPDTLRRWADDGRVRAYATPGGHRRFSRADLDRLAVSRRAVRRPLSTLGATSDRVNRAYVRSYRTDSGPPAIDRLEAETRAEFRTDGRRLVAVLLAYLDASRPVDRARWETEALGLIEITARRLAAAGASGSDVVAVYVRARHPFLTEIGSLGRRRALDATQLASLFEQAVALLDRLLLHLVAVHADMSARRAPREVPG
ncbi:MAG: excisionase family DNA-binding protein [Chloroflexi bacterium]|nr:excisionase family DNA-binding protein [Chloroflexota bacterium]